MRRPGNERQRRAALKHLEVLQVRQVKYSWGRE